ncbi:MAG TPA: ATP-binding cassette domain-containing protein, partial [Methanospirillum sp.]|uniref:ATP-binding cassette domain-containing protein n=1 Tax=Methanospirillum sp. TaxID=45200 RepID=UPI002B74D9D3
RDLCHIYSGSITALEGINFIAPRNCRIAVIGPNGAGKSTLFKHLNGILKPSSGMVLVNGEPIRTDNIRNIRKKVGIVFQNPDDQIFSPTVEQDVAFGPMNLGLDPDTVEHRVCEALKIVNLEDYRHRVPHRLSGGEKKRVAIAGILAMEPEVLVLDEPTAGLDPAGVQELVGYIKEFATRYGITVIFSTHDIGLVSELAQIVYVMDKGRCIAQGSIDEIFSQSELLKSVRLDIPVLPKLLKSLQMHGVPVEMGFTYEETEVALLKAFGKIS